MDRKFDLQEYMNRELPESRGAGSTEEEIFRGVLDMVSRQFDLDWERTDDQAKNMKLEREKRAIIGYDREVKYYKARIREILQERHMMKCRFPPWYPSLTEAVFAELYGLAGLAPWAYDMQEKYRRSSSAKLIGDRLYCLIDGRSQLQPQRIPEKRRIQLKRSLLLASPAERMEYGFHELYLVNGIRITIYSGDRTKEGQDVMVFRKYVMRDLSFEAMVRLGTIPPEAPALFRVMIRLGFNVIFGGQVRSGKTTFLQTWQKYENRELEGMAIATDPETPWHELMPEAPLMQLVADGPRLEEITKSLLRGDNDYILLEEMRDAAAFRLALDITSTGTMRSKATIHDNDAVSIPYRMASKIRERYGGDLNALIASVFQNFDYVIELCQDPVNRSKKIMKGIVELSYDPERDQVSAVRICRYDFSRGIWLWRGVISPDVARKVAGDDGLPEMERILRELEEQSPDPAPSVLHPAYYHGGAE